MNEHRIRTAETEELETRLKRPAIRNNLEDQRERLACLIELQSRDQWTKPPTRRPWVAVATETPSVGEPVLCWRPGEKRPGCCFYPGAIFVAYWDGTDWILTETGGNAEDSRPSYEPTHWRPLPSTR